MIHQYQSNGFNIVLDVNSGCVHVVDELVYRMIPLVESLVNEEIKDKDTILAAVLGLEELHFYDIYTPLVSDVDKEIPYEEAKQTVYDALAPLGEDYRKILKEGFENRWHAQYILILDNLVSLKLNFPIYLVALVIIFEVFSCLDSVE